MVQKSAWRCCRSLIDSHGVTVSSRLAIPALWERPAPPDFPAQWNPICSSVSSLHLLCPMYEWDEGGEVEETTPGWADEQSWLWPRWPSFLQRTFLQKFKKNTGSTVLHTCTVCETDQLQELRAQSKWGWEAVEWITPLQSILQQQLHKRVHVSVQEQLSAALLVFRSFPAGKPAAPLTQTNEWTESDTFTASQQEHWKPPHHHHHHCSSTTGGLSSSLFATMGKVLCEEAFRMSCFILLFWHEPPMVQVFTSLSLHPLRWILLLLFSVFAQSHERTFSLEHVRAADSGTEDDTIISCCDTTTAEGLVKQSFVVA